MPFCEECGREVDEDEIIHHTYFEDASTVENIEVCEDCVELFPDEVGDDEDSDDETEG